MENVPNRNAERVGAKSSWALNKTLGPASKKNARGAAYASRTARIAGQRELTRATDEVHAAEPLQVIDAAARFHSKYA